MGLIKSVNEITLTRTVQICIYGKAGTGKTTLALSAPRPLYIDLDNGAKRVRNEHLQTAGIVQVGQFSDLNALLAEDLTAFDTLIIDTVGKLVDFAIFHRCGTGTPQLKQWGMINNDCINFLRSCRSLGKNVILVAHEEERQGRGDGVRYMPKIREKVYADLITELDLLGYVEMATDTTAPGGRTTRTITFDPTERNEGKNTCNLPAVMPIPQIVDRATGQCISENDFISTRILAPYHAMLQQKEDEAKAYQVLIREIEDDIALITDAKSATDFVGRVTKGYKHIGNSLLIARQRLVAKTSSLGLIYNKESNAYEHEPAQQPA